LGNRRSENDKMSIPLWKKFGSEERHRVKKEDGEEDKKHREG